MKQIVTTFAIGAVLASALPLSAQTETMVFDLRKNESYERCSQTCLKYDRYDPDYDTTDEAWTWRSSYPAMNYYGITNGYYDDYLVTPDLDLEEGTLYCIHLSPAAESAYVTQQPGLVVWLGQGNNVASYTELKAYDGIVNSTQSEAEALTINFNVETAGKYRIAFEGLKYKLYLYDTYIVSLGTSAAPAMAVNLTVYPDADGAAKAEVVFTMPSATTSGMGLTDELRYTIYRGEEAAKSGRAMPGEEVRWIDEAVAEGGVTYSVEVSAGDEVSERVSVTTFVGEETPLSVENVLLTSKGSEHVVEWSAPTVGVHGAMLDPAKLKYAVVRIVDGESAAVTENLTGVTKYVDNFVPEGLQSLSYSVAVSLGSKSADAVESNRVKIGSIDLPFADSFAGGDLSPDNWDKEVLNGTLNWEVLASSDKGPECEPYDNDGGLLRYNSWNAPKGNSARIMTMPISRASTTNPVVQFYQCHSASGNDVLKVQVSVDNGEWVDVANATTMVKAPEGVNAKEWIQYVFNIGEAIPEDCVSYRVAFTSVSDYGHNIVLDNVRIFNLAGNDLEAVSLTGADRVNAGQELELALTIANNGGKDVGAGEYEIMIMSDLGEEIAVPASVDIASLKSAILTIKVPFTAVHAMSADRYAFSAEITYPIDEVPENNVVEEKVVAVGFSENTPVTALSVDNSEGGKMLVWEPASDQTYVPVDLHESFEDFEKDATDNLNGIVVLDLDEKSASSAYYSVSGSKFKVAEKFSNMPGGMDGGKVLGVTFPKDVKQDDWIILPAHDCKPSATMTLSFMAGFRKYSYASYSFEVVYATGDYDPTDPAAAFTNVIKMEQTSNYGGISADDAMHTVSYENIPAEARYVAIHFNSKINYDGVVWVDNIELTENDEALLLGYHVYEHSVGRINCEMLGSDATSFDLATARFASIQQRGVKDPVRQYYVTAVYPDGESRPSPMVSDGTPSGVEPVAMAGGFVRTYASGVVVGGFVGEMADVYDLAGRMVASVVCSSETRIALPAGIYVVKVGEVCGKVAVR